MPLSVTPGAWFSAIYPKQRQAHAAELRWYGFRGGTLYFLIVSKIRLQWWMTWSSAMVFCYLALTKKNPCISSDDSKAHYFLRSWIATENSKTKFALQVSESASSITTNILKIEYQVTFSRGTKPQGNQLLASAERREQTTAELFKKMGFL